METYEEIIFLQLFLFKLDHSTHALQFKFQTCFRLWEQNGRIRPSVILQIFRLEINSQTQGSTNASESESRKEFSINFFSFGNYIKGKNTKLKEQDKGVYWIQLLSPCSASILVLLRSKATLGYKTGIYNRNLTTSMCTIENFKLSTYGQ